MEGAKLGSDSGEEFGIPAPKKAAIVHCVLLELLTHCFSAVQQLVV